MSRLGYMGDRWAHLGEDLLRELEKHSAACDVAKEPRGQEEGVDNKLDSPLGVYLNPGGWTDGRTDFAIVSADQIALCSWERPPDHFEVDKSGLEKVRTKGRRDWVKYGAAAPDETSIGADNLIFDFLDLYEVIPKNERHVKHVFGSYRIPIQPSNKDEEKIHFTERDEAIVFLPDIHMHLFRESGADAFTRKEQLTVEGKQVTKRHSQVDRLVRFLDYCATFQRQACPKLKVIQLGDLVDIWHTQLICYVAHRYLCVQRKPRKGVAEPEIRGIRYAYRPLNREAAKQYNEPHVWLGASALVDMKDEHKARPYFRTVDSRDWPKNVNAFDAMALYLMRNKLTHIPLSIKLQSFTVDYTSWDSIRNEIPRRYPELGDPESLDSHWDSMVTVPGNHDMEVEHPYLGFRYKYKFGKNITNVLGKTTFAEKCEARSIARDYGVKLFVGDDPTNDHVRWINHEDDEAEGPTATPLNQYTQLTATQKRKRKEHGFLTGKENCIWFEHGHAFDPYNNRHTFFREDRPRGAVDQTVGIKGGFMTTMNSVSRGLKGKGVPQWLLRKANSKLNRYCGERCKKVIECKGHGSDTQGPVHLVVLAHTHYPWLIGDAVNAPLDELTRG